MGEQLPPQSIDHFVAERGGDKDLRVGEEPAAQRNQHDGAGAFHDQHYFAAVHEALEKTQKMRQRFIQDAVIQDQLERPGLQQLGSGHAQSAEGRQTQTPFDVTQVRQKYLTESFSFSSLHGDLKRDPFRAPASWSAPAPAPPPVRAPRARARRIAAPAAATG